MNTDYFMKNQTFILKIALAYICVLAWTEMFQTCQAFVGLWGSFSAGWVGRRHPVSGETVHHDQQRSPVSRRLPHHGVRPWPRKFLVWFLVLYWFSLLCLFRTMKRIQERMSLRMSCKPTLNRPPWQTEGIKTRQLFWSWLPDWIV